MTKRMRTALLHLHGNHTVASASDVYDALVKLGYAKSIGLIPTSGSPRCTTLKSGYAITDSGKQRAEQLLALDKQFE